MRIGFFGLANRPAHLGHQLIGEELISCGLFDMVIACPYGYSEEKPHSLMALHMHQLANLAFPKKWTTRPEVGCAKFLLDPTTATSRDIPTAKRYQLLQTHFPGAELCFVTGSDRLDSISRWENFHFLQQQQMLIMPRPGYFQSQDFDLARILPKAKWYVPKKRLLQISSSDVRNHRIAGIPGWRQMVNDDVGDYIDLYDLFKE